MRRTGEIPRRPEQPKICTVEFCVSPTTAKGLCDKHYRRLLNRGVTTARTLKERFLKYVPERPDDDCWQWQGHGRVEGYGQFKIGQKQAQAHRVSYEIFVGPIPEGLHIDHLCMNKGCVNPDHLEAVTQRENNLRSFNMAGQFIRRTVCHICGGELVFYPNRAKYGVRVCMECQRRRSTKSRLATRARQLSELPSDVRPPA